MLITLALVTALFSPAKPTVGDRVTIRFEAPVKLDASKDFEVVAHSENVVVIRTFQTKPVALSGETGGVRFRNLMLPVTSVLAPRDSLKPAPLVPPRVPDTPRVPLYFLAGAAVAAVAAWALAYFRRASASRPRVIVVPAEAFRNAVKKAAKSRQPWAALADATRGYLASRGVGLELTTSEALGIAGSYVVDEALRGPSVEALSDILQRGDLEKFSPWGAPAGDFDSVAARALSLVEAFEPPPPPTAEVAA